MKSTLFITLIFLIEKNSTASAAATLVIAFAIAAINITSATSPAILNFTYP